MKAIDLIKAERTRQINVEGFTESHDDRHVSGEIGDAAICYASAASKMARGESLAYVKECVSAMDRGFPWPWEEEWWNPSSTQIKNLVKAGALIVAEIERLQRAEQKAAE